MSEHNDGGSSGTNGEDSEIFKRAKSAEEALKTEREARLKLEADLAAERAKSQGANQLDTKTIDERFSKIEQDTHEEKIARRTVDLANTLGIDNALAGQIMQYTGGDLNKAIDEARKDGSVFKLAVEQAVHKKSLSRNTPSAESAFGGDYVVEGKKKNFFELPEDQQRQAYKNEVRNATK